MISLRSERVRLTVAPAFGCRWMRLEINVRGQWKDILVPASLDRLRKDPLFDGAYLLAPWCNRIPGASFRFQGKNHRLNSNFPDGSAIHGDAWGRHWTVTNERPGAFEAELDSRTQETFNFPWPVTLRHGVRLTARGVSAWISVKNTGTTVIPAGLGFHPFLARPEDGVLRVPAKRYFPSKNALPIGASRAVKEQTHSLDTTEVDRGFTALKGAVRLDTKAGYEVVLSPGAGAEHLFVWAPHRFRDKDADFLCIEPMTMSVDGFGRKECGAKDSGVRLLKPRETLTLRWRLEARGI